MVTFFPAIPVDHACTLVAALRRASPPTHPPGLPRRARGAAGIRRRAGPRARAAGHPGSAPTGARGSDAEQEGARPRGPGRAAAAGRALVLPPGRPAGRRDVGLVRAARPHRLERDPCPAQLERHRPHAEPAHLGLVPQGVPAAQGPEGTEAGLEGPVRGLELPHHRLAERQEDRRLHRILPLRARPQGASLRAQQPRRARVHAAQPHRPDPLAARRLQRLWHGGMVELRRPAARGVRAPGGHRGRGARAGPPPRSAAGRAGPGGGAHDAAQPHRQGPQRRAGAPPDGPGRGPAHRHETRDRARRRPAPARHPRDHPEAEAVAARASGPLRAERVRGPGAEGQAPHGPGSAAPAGGHLPPQLRGQEARVAAGRALPERPAAEPARRQRARGRHQRGGGAVTGHALIPAAPAARPRRQRHPLPLPAPPGVHRGARPARDPLLGGRSRVPAAQQLLRHSERPRLGHPGGSRHREREREPRLDLHLVAGQRAGRQPSRAGRGGRGPRRLHPRRRRGGTGDRRHAADRHRSPVARRASRSTCRRTGTSTCSA